MAKEISTLDVKKLPPVGYLLKLGLRPIDIVTLLDMDEEEIRTYLEKRKGFKQAENDDEPAPTRQDKKHMRTAQGIVFEIQKKQKKLGIK